MTLAAPFFAVRVDIEFVAGTWTDVTQWVDWSAGWSLHVGRNTTYDPPAPSVFSCTLKNSDGRFTPDRQTLFDGTAHPYWPNVLPRRRLRFSWVFGTDAPRAQFTGYVAGFPPGFEADYRPVVAITATDVGKQLAKRKLLSAIATEVVADAPKYYWPLTDDGGNRQAEFSGGPPFGKYGTPTQDTDTPSFGYDDLGSGNGPLVRFDPPNTAAAPFPGWILSSDRTRYDISNGISIELWAVYDVNAFVWQSGVSYYSKLLQIDNGRNYADAGQQRIVLDVVAGTASGDELKLAAVVDSGAATTTLTSIGKIGLFRPDSPAAEALYNEGQPTHIVLTLSPAGTLRIYIDGFLDRQTTGAPALTSQLRWTSVGGQWNNDGTGSVVANFGGLVGHVVVYEKVLTAAQVVQHWQAGTGWRGETTSQRATRIYGQAGVPLSTSFDGSTVTLNSYSQTDQTVPDALQAVVTSEGGGAAAWIDGDGLGRFRNRNARGPGDPVVTLDADLDVQVAGWQPEHTDDTLVNSVRGIQANGISDSATSRYATNQASIDAYDESTDSFTTWADDDDQIRYEAQYRVAIAAAPLVRVPKLAVDLFTGCQDLDQQKAIAACSIGDRLRLTNIGKWAGLPPTIDVFAEGWTDSGDESSYVRSFDATRADELQFGVYDDPATARYQTSGHTLHAALTAAATTVVVDSPAGDPTFTTDPAAYPLTIQVGAEHIQLTGAPSGSASPQTFTGCVRGVDSTDPTAQAAGAAVQLYPLTVYAP